MDDVKNSDVKTHPHEQEDQAAIDACRKELAQAKERYLYLQAECDNYKKRIEKERASWIDAAQDAVLIDVLGIVDDMDRALQGLQNIPEGLLVHVTGFEMIAKSLHKILSKYQVQEIPYAKHFDPEYYEAVMQVASEKHQSGEIVSILQKGYVRKDRVLRPAKVSVAQ